MQDLAARAVLVALVGLLFCSHALATEDLGLTLSWKDNYLTLRGEKLPGREIEVLYIEAYCRPGRMNGSGSRPRSATRPGWCRRTRTASGWNWSAC